VKPLCEEDLDKTKLVWLEFDSEESNQSTNLRNKYRPEISTEASLTFDPESLFFVSKEASFLQKIIVEHHHHHFALIDSLSRDFCRGGQGRKFTTWEVHSVVPAVTVVSNPR
jgi:hypothetical protein